MRHRSAHVLLDTPLVRVADVMCQAPRSQAGDEECANSTQLIVPRRGVFTLQRHGEAVVADPNTVVVFGAGADDGPRR